MQFNHVQIRAPATTVRAQNNSLQGTLLLRLYSHSPLPAPSPPPCNHYSVLYFYNFVVLIKYVNGVMQLFSFSPVLIFAVLDLKVD